MDELLTPGRRTLPEMLRFAAERFSAREACLIPGAQWSHRDLPQAAARRAGAMQAAGMKHGDRVAVMCGNRAELLEVFLACGWMGAVCVPINTASMGPQIAYYLENSGARLLVVEERFVERLSRRPASVWILDQDYPPP